MSQTSLDPLPLSVIQALDVGKQSRAGALGLLIYDHLLTFGMEVEYVWPRKWNTVQFLYFFNRWLAIIWLSFDTIPLSPSGVVSPKICIIYLMFDDIVTLVTTLTVQVILQLRVYAIYERSRKILVFLLVMCSLEVSVMAILIGVTISRTAHLPVVSTPTGCSYTGFLPASSLFWTPALVFEPILCILVVVKTRHSLFKGKFWHSAPYLQTLLARDSLIYFFMIFIELLAATIIWAHFPHYINVINPWASAIPSILGSRLILNMRKRLREPEMSSTEDPESELPPSEDFGMLVIINPGVNPMRPEIPAVSYG